MGPAENCIPVNEAHSRFLILRDPMELAYSYLTIPGAPVEGKLHRPWPPPSPSSIHGFSLRRFYLPLFLPLPRTVVALLSSEVHHQWLLLVPDKTHPLPLSPSLLLLPLLFLSTASSLIHRRGLEVCRRPLSFFADTLARCQCLPAPSARRRPPSCSLYHHRCRPLSLWLPPPLMASPPLSSLPSPSLLPSVDSGSFFPSPQALAFPPSTLVPSSRHHRSRASLHLLSSPFAVIVLCCRRGLTVVLPPWWLAGRIDTFVKAWCLAVVIWSWGPFPHRNDTKPSLFG